MTLDQLLRDAGTHVDALIDRHVASAPRRVDATTTTNTREDGLMTVIEQPPRTGEPVGRSPRRWGVAAAIAAAAALIVVGMLALRRDDDAAVDTAPADIPAPSSLSAAGAVQDNRIEKLVFDGRSLWSVRNGSTFLLKMKPSNGEVIESFSLPEAATPGRPVVQDGMLYVPSSHGVVVVDTRTNRIDEPVATGDGEVWSVAFTTDSAWLVRRLPQRETLERWSPGFDQLLTSIDLGSEESVGIAGVGGNLWLASAQDGLKKYDSSGTVVATIPGIGVAWEMEAGADGTLWIADFFAGDLVAVDTTTDAVRSRVAISGADVMSLAVTPRSVWVTARSGKQLAVVDPATGEVTATVALGGTPLALTLADGAAWVSGEGGWAERFVPG